jgi:predicted RNase H-like nuclease (RuvC/YqgF family)
MKSPQQPPQESDQNLANSQAQGQPEAEFEQSLAAVEQSLQNLKDRYQQVKTDQQQQAELQERYDRLKQSLQPANTSELQPELRQIQSQIEALELNLESRLISESSLREIFWQVVRFGGLGLVIGWFLAFVVIQSPSPPPQTSPPPESPQ